MKKILQDSFVKLILPLLILVVGTTYAQPTVLFTGLNSTTPAPTNNRFALNDMGVFRQIRFQSNQAASVSSTGWAFHSGTPGSPNYNPCWRPYTGGNTLGVNGFIPTSFANGAKYNTGGGADGLLPAITSGNYYTFNVMENGSADSNMGLLETSYNPVGLVSQSVVLPLSATGTGTVSITTSAAPSSGEFVYMRYSLDNWVTSAYLAMTFTGNTGTAFIPCDPSPGSPVQYYFFSSNKTKAQIDADVITFATQNVFDIYTLNLLNNSGSNYSYTQPSTTGFTGVYNVPGSCYPTLASFITALNGGTVTGPVTVRVAAGYTETAPAGGFSITQTGTSANTITFVKDGIGANPTFTAPLWAAGGLTDGIIKIIGGDYITIDGFTVQENIGNVVVATGATNTMTEVGIGLYLAAATNGAQNNTIQNCTISLSSLFPNTVGVFSSSSSSSTNGVLAASATTGTNSNNKIYSNTINNVAFGVYTVCEPITGTITESGWDIGGTSSSTGNTITFGNATTSTIAWARFAPSSTGGIVLRNGAGFNARYNTITSNNVAYGQSNFGGILVSNGSVPTGFTYASTISNNTITLSSTGTTGITAIDFAYGIATGTIVSNSNTISINSGSTVASSATMYGIKASYTSNTNTISGNTITYNQSGSGTWSGALYYIGADGSSNTMTIQNNNLLSTGGHIKTTGTIYGITHNGTIATSLTVGDVANGNTINYTASGASGIRYGIFSNASTTVAVTNYKVSNNSITISGLTGTASAVAINNTDGGQPVKVFDTNTINISGVNTGATSGYTLNFGTVTVSNSNITISNAATSNMGVNFTASSLNAATATGNTISVTSSAVTPTLYGINSSATGITNGFTITNNIINTISASGASTSAPIISGIRISVGSTNTISGNTVSGISTGAGSGSATVNGIEINGGTTNNIFRNKIYGIGTSCSGTLTLVSGIRVTSGTTNNIYNNTVGLLNASSAASLDAIRGLNFTSTATSTQNIFHNTIYLNASSSGANFGSTGIFHTTSATATVSALNLRNNIVINNSTPAGTGFTAAYRRSSATLTNYATTSDNNLFYAGTPGANNVLFFDGTNSDQTLAAFKTRMATRDQASQTENTTFQSTTGSDANFLRIAAGTTSYAESGAVLITTPNINTDYWGVTRPFTSPVNGGTGVDIGASEFDGIPSLVNCIAPIDQATAFVAGAVTSNSAAATFTAAASAPTGYLVVSANNTPFVGTPVDGTSYTAGNALGNGAVIQSGSSTSISVVGLPNNTTGNLAIFSYNSGSCAGGPKYNLVSPLTGTNTTCAGAPTLPVTNVITGTSFTTNWTANIGGNAFPLTYSVEVTTDAAYASPIAGSPFTTTSISQVISGLSPQTNYYWRVKANNTICDSAYLNAGLVTTECAAVTTFPSVEPFAAYLPSTCWKEGDLGDLTAGPSLVTATASSWDVDGFLNSGTTGAARLNIFSGADSDWLLTPYYSIPATGYRVKYNVGATNFNVTTPVTNWEADDFVQLLVSTSNTNWTVLRTYNSSNVPSNLGQVDESDLSAYNGQTVRFAFRGVEGATDGAADLDFFIDNFTVEVTPVAITASASVNPICSGDSTTLSVSSANTNYAYTWSPATGLSATTGSSVTANPTTTTTYTINAVDGSMVNTTTVTVTVNPAPSAITVTPATASVCQDAITSLVVSGGSFVTSIASGTGALTTVAATTASTLGPNPMQTYYGGSKQQMLYTAAELTDLGFTAGTIINSIAFEMSAVEARTLQNYEISMQNSALTSFASTSFVTSGLTNVKLAGNVTPTTGLNTISLDTPFAWNGTSSLLIQISFSNADNGGAGTNTAKYDTTAFASTLFYRVDGTSAATVASAATASFAAYSSRNNVVFGLLTPTVTWSPQTDLYTDAAANTAYTGQNLTTVYHKGATNTYVATATLGSCPKTASTTITVNPNVTPTFNQVAPICSGDAFTLPNTSIEGVTGTWSPAINNTTTTVYTFTPTLGQCATTATMTVNVGGTTTWTAGTPNFWSNGAPTSIDAAVISANYSEAATLNACTLTVNNNAVVTIPSNTNINLQGAITVSSGSMMLNNNANLIQTRDVNNTGNISIKRETATLMRLDYALWSAPVTGQQLQSFSPGTLANRFYTYNPTNNNYEVIASPSSTNFSEGTGYLIRVPNGHPTTPTILSRTFTGVPNNGDVSLTVANNTYNAVGNPYPSKIDADAFITDNGITEALYFWRKTNNAGTSTSYASYTTAGGVANTGFDPLGLVPNGIIQTGQGFIAKSTSTSLNFTNSMRVQDTSNQFFRATENRSRVWLNMTNNDGYFCQALVAYMPNATTGVDAAIDGRLLNDEGNATTLSTIINNEEFAIQGRPTFSVSDVVAVGFKSELPGNFNIAINNVDGLFTQGQEVFLKDNLTNTIHSLTNSPYTFATEAGVFNTRFEIVYESTLSTENPILNENNIVAYTKDTNLIVNSGKAIMKEVKVYDIQGRLLVEKNNINATETKLPISDVNQVLIVKVTTNENLVITKKIIN